jgi:hypothetical protein
MRQDLLTLSQSHTMGNKMKKIMQSFTAALVLAGLAVSAQATPVVVDFNQDLQGFAVGTQISTQLAGVTFSLTDANDVAVGAPIYSGGSSISNYLTVGGPTIANLLITFASEASNISFGFLGSPPRTWGAGSTNYQAWNANGTLIAAGGLTGLDSMSLPDGIAKIRINTFNGGIDEWTGEVAPPWQLDIYELHAELNVPSVSAVPEPEAAAMLLGGLAVLGAVRRRSRRQPMVYGSLSSSV